MISVPPIIVLIGNKPEAAFYVGFGQKLLAELRADLSRMYESPFLSGTRVKSIDGGGTVTASISGQNSSIEIFMPAIPVEIEYEKPKPEEIIGIHLVIEYRVGTHGMPEQNNNVIIWSPQENKLSQFPDREPIVYPCKRSLINDLIEEFEIKFTGEVGEDYASCYGRFPTPGTPGLNAWGRFQSNFLTAYLSSTPTLISKTKCIGMSGSPWLSKYSHPADQYREDDPFTSPCGIVVPDYIEAQKNDTVSYYLTGLGETNHVGQVYEENASYGAIWDNTPTGYYGQLHSIYGYVETAANRGAVFCYPVSLELEKYLARSLSGGVVSCGNVSDLIETTEEIRTEIMTVEVPIGSFGPFEVVYSRWAKNGVVSDWAAPDNTWDPCNASWEQHNLVNYLKQWNQPIPGRPPDDYWRTALGSERVYRFYKNFMFQVYTLRDIYQTVERTSTYPCWWWPYIFDVLLNETFERRDRVLAASDFYENDATNHNPLSQTENASFRTEIEGLIEFETQAQVDGGLEDDRLPVGELNYYLLDLSETKEI